MRYGKPLIGVTISIDPGKRLRAGHEYLYIKRSYSACITQVGGHPLLIPPDMEPSAVAEVCDGLVISGGDDLPETFDARLKLDAPLAEVEDRIAYERLLTAVGRYACASTVSKRSRSAFTFARPSVARKVLVSMKSFLLISTWMLSMPRAGSPMRLISSLPT